MIKLAIGTRIFNIFSSQYWKCKYSAFLQKTISFSWKIVLFQTNIEMIIFNNYLHIVINCHKCKYFESIDSFTQCINCSWKCRLFTHHIFTHFWDRLVTKILLFFLMNYFPYITKGSLIQWRRLQRWKQLDKKK